MENAKTTNQFLFVIMLIVLTSTIVQIMFVNHLKNLSVNDFLSTDLQKAVKKINDII